MLKRLDRYILKELLGPFFLGMFILLFILVSQQILKLMELVIDKGVHLLSVLELFLRILPSFLVITIPMAVMMATVTTFSRLSADNEIIALHASGVSFYRIFRPVLIFAFVVGLLTLSMGFLAGPNRGSLSTLAVKLLMNQASVGLEEGQFNGVFSNMMIYVESMPTFSKLKGVFIYDQRKKDAPVTITAREAVIVSDPNTQTISMHLIEGSLHQKIANSNQYQKMTFANYAISLNFSEMAQRQAEDKGQSYAQLQKRVTETQGKDIKVLRKLSRFYRRYLFSLAAVVFCIMGVPLGIISGRITRVGGISAGIFMIILYYILLTLGDSLIAAGIATPFMAALFPILVLIPLCVYLVKKIATQVSPTLFGMASKRP